MSLRQELIDRHNGDIDEAAAYLARGLSQDDPATFKVGYTPENATLAARDLFPEVEASTIQQINGWEPAARPRLANHSGFRGDGYSVTGL